MSSVFKKYAGFYDLYYKDKYYGEEVDFVLKLADENGLNPKSMLDMGCGTGRHLAEFCQRGLECDGFDLSADMLEQARQRVPGNVSLQQCNITEFRNGKTYDLVVSLFAVMGYLTNNQDLSNGFKTAATHLKTGGLFIFDSWFGPAVLSEKPEVRTHHYEDGQTLVSRKATPVPDCVKQTVTVNYEIAVKEGETQEIFQEAHNMRYFFVQEIALLAENNGFELVAAQPFLGEGDLSSETWNSCFVLKKVR